MVSGRASFEILQKSLAARHSGVSGGVRAVESGGGFRAGKRADAGRFLRDGRMNVYSEVQTVRFPTLAQPQPPRGPGSS